MSLRYLRMYFPELPFLEAPGLHLHYSKGNSQIGSMLRQLPTLLCFIRKDHKWIKEVVMHHHFDLVISDNRFGLYTSLTRTVYITHQVMVKMPQGLTFAEKWAYRLHRLFIDQYNYCLMIAGCHWSRLPPSLGLRGFWAQIQISIFRSANAAGVNSVMRGDCFWETKLFSVILETGILFGQSWLRNIITSLLNYKQKSSKGQSIIYWKN